MHHIAQNIKSFVRSVTIYITLFLFGLGQVSLAIAQTASLLPNAEQTFFDTNGHPLTSGTVTHYIPGTSTLKTTWQDANQAVANSNPLTLDSAGRAIIYGTGNYRQLVKDRQGNTIWDQVTSSASVNIANPTQIGDGHPVGTVLAWTGLTAPSNYVFGYGQELNRVTYDQLLSVLTTTQSVFCTASSATLTGLTDTSQIPTGAPIEASCIPSGTTVSSKTSTTLTLNNPATTSVNTTAVIYPWGNGNGTTTFNVPDFRGRVIAGRDNMGGTASSRMTSTYYTVDPAALAATGGTQSKTLASNMLPPYTPAGTIAVSVNPTITTAINVQPTISSPAITITDPGHTHAGGGLFDAASTNNNFAVTGAGTAVVAVNNSGGESTASSTTGITAALATAPVASGGTYTSSASGGTYTFTGTAQGGTSVAFSAIQPTVTVNYVIKVLPDANISTLNVVTSINNMTGNLSCGTGLTCSSQTISAAVAMSDVLAVNTYVDNLAADVTPDASGDYLMVRRASDGLMVKMNVGTIATAATSGVSSLGGMTGAITCGSGLTCVGTTISSGSVGVSAINTVTGSLTVNGLVNTSGTTFAANNGCGGTQQVKTANYTLVNGDIYNNFALGGANQYTITAAAAAGYTTGYSVCLYNNSARGRIISLNGLSDFILWPLQSVIVFNNGAAGWAVTSGGGAKIRWKIPSGVIFRVDATGSDSNDCLGTGTAACQTIQGAMNKICSNVDAGNQRVTISIAAASYTENVRLCDPVGANQGGYDLALNPLIEGNGSNMNCGASTCFVGVKSTAGWQIQNITTSGTGNSIQSDAGSHIYIGSSFTSGVTGIDFLASFGGLLEVIGTINITNNKAWGVYAIGGGSQFITAGASNIFFGGTAFSQTWISAQQNAVASLNGTYSGATTQPAGNCVVAVNGGGIANNGAGLVGLPCSTTANIINPGWLY